MPELSAHGLNAVNRDLAAARDRLGEIQGRIDDLQSRLEEARNERAIWNDTIRELESDAELAIPPERRKRRTTEEDDDAST